MDRIWKAEKILKFCTFFFFPAPLPPTNVNILAKTDSIELTWEYNYTQSNVEFWNITINGTIYEIAGNNTKCKIGNLLSGTNYKISIWSSAANETSSQLTKSISTCKYIWYFVLCFSKLQFGIVYFI